MMGGYFELKQAVLFNYGEVITATSCFGLADSIDYPCNGYSLLKKMV